MNGWTVLSATPRTSRDRRLVWILLGAFILIVIILVAALTRPGGDDANSQPISPNAPVAEEQAGQGGDAATELPDLSRRIEGDPAALGDVNAPVVLIEFADFRCPFCGVFARETHPELIEEYVDAGLLRIEWRDVPVFGDESFNAAVAARAAGEQGMFWDYSAAVFAHEGSGHQDLPRERLIEIAAEVSIPDLAAFEAALDDTELAQAVSADLAEAQALGVRSTPTFVIGQTPIMGAQPVEAFRAAIDAELEKANS